MKRIIIAVLAFAFFQHHLSSQTISDALRVSTLDAGSSTARSLGVGGAIGALGADFSVSSSNPAGLANFRKSQFVISPQFSSNKTNALLSGDAGNVAYREGLNKINFGSIGLLINANRPDEKWTSLSFGIGLNRLANFNQEITYTGKSEGTIANRFLELTQGLTSDEMDQFEGLLAYNTGVVFDKNPNDLITAYTTDFAGYPDTKIIKNQNINTKGYNNELVFSLAGNYKEKLLIGATIGVPFVRYSETKIYGEKDYVPDSIKYFNSLTFTENLNITGAGFNAKVGAIYNVNHNVRLGLAFHSPTIISFTDNYSNKLVYDYTAENNDGPVSAESPEGSFAYSISTPWRALGSASYLFNKYGFISSEIEYVDYGAARFDFKNADLDAKAYEASLNTSIKEKYKSGVNFKLGAEAAFEMLRLRGGIGFIATPYKNDHQYSKVYSLGAGINGKNMFFDFAYQTQKINEGFEPYTTANAVKQQVETTFKTNIFLATLGFKF
ncbi:MAG: outer membrane protein transport protein [Saprospiraceae bacterium]|nr:outer membrane protein transport protein [Saprospiraceae bacterium]